jgi:hypothetical protein
VAARRREWLAVDDQRLMNVGAATGDGQKHSDEKYAHERGRE